MMTLPRPSPRAPPGSAAAPAAREHRWDGLRGVLMLLGIPYHAAMCLRDGNPWIVASPRGGLFYTWLADLIHLFRMPAFFIVAGYFTALILARRAPGAWLRSRLTRLGIPFLTALVLIVPVLNIFCELSGLAWPQAVAAFRHNMATSGGYWIRHLWFLIVLGYYSALVAVAVSLWPALARARWNGRSGALPVVCTLALAVGVYEALVALPFRHIDSYAARWLQEIFRLDETALYLPFFAIGLAIHRVAAIRAAFGRTTLPLAVLTAAMTIAGVALQHMQAWPVTAMIVSGAAALLIGQQLIAAAGRWFDRPSLPIDRLVAASFVIYLLHLPVIAMLFDLLMPLELPLIVEFALVCMVTLASCYAAARAIARVALLDLLFNGRVRRHAVGPSAAAPPSA